VMRRDWFSEEKVLREVILPELKEGRPDFDLAHTEAVVVWMKRLLESLGFGPTKGEKNDSAIDARVMVTAAYAHDWGYVGLFPDGANYDQVQAMKPKHMEKGAEKIEKLLKEKLSDGYTNNQIDRVAHLVRVHDKLEVVSDEDELLLVEADTLGALDADLVTPTFSKADNQRYVVELERKRRPLFIHKAAVKAYDELLIKRINFYAEE